MRIGGLHRRAACQALILLALPYPQDAFADEVEQSQWRLAASTPVIHVGDLWCACTWLTENWFSIWALGATFRLERLTERRSWAGELSVEVLSAAGRPNYTRRDFIAEHPIQVRLGLGRLFRTYDGRRCDVQLYPRGGLFYGDYGKFFGAFGFYGGLATDGLWWLGDSFALSATVDLRAGVWSSLKKYEFEDSAKGVLVAAEGLVGFVVVL